MPKSTYLAARPRPRPRLLGFLTFLKNTLLPKFENMIENELLIVGTQQLEDIFSIELKNLLQSQVPVRQSAAHSP